jgi:geranylgeranyl diphosphate synthase, type III
LHAARFPNVLTWEKVVMEPYNYLLQIPGKAVRTKLIHAFNVWMGAPHDKVEAISRIIQMLHTASLL